MCSLSKSPFWLTEVRLEGSLSILILWKLTLPTVGRLDLNSEGPFQTKPSYNSVTGIQKKKKKTVSYTGFTEWNDEQNTWCLYSVCFKKHQTSKQ